MEDSREVFRFTILTGAGNIRRSSDDDYILSGNEKPVEPRVIQYRFAKILKTENVRSEQGAKYFLTLKSLTSTAAKMGITAFDALFFFFLGSLLWGLNSYYLLFFKNFISSAWLSLKVIETSRLSVT